MPPARPPRLWFPSPTISDVPAPTGLTQRQLKLVSVLFIDRAERLPTSPSVKQSYLMNAAAYTPRISRTSNRTNRQVQILLRSVEELDGNTLQRNSSGFADKA
jgi:hypothetical protein